MKSKKFKVDLTHNRHGLATVEAEITAWPTTELQA
jgi:hypothetical protein